MSHKNKPEKTILRFFGFHISKEKIIIFLFVLAVIVAICILLDSIIVIKQGWAECSFIFLCLCLWFYHDKKRSNNQNLYKKVAWIAEKESYDMHCSYLRDFKLVEYIEIEQRNQNTPEQFRIDFSNQTEKEHLAKILDAHKEDVVKSFFGGQLAESKNIYALGPLEYYFVSLNCFVSKHCNKEYMSDGDKLNDYGRACYKLYLITQVYIENNERVQMVFEYIDKQIKNHIMEVLGKTKLSL